MPVSSAYCQVAPVLYLHVNIVSTSIDLIIPHHTIITSGAAIMQEGVLYSTVVQYSTVQNSTAQYSTVQYCILKVFMLIINFAEKRPSFISYLGLSLDSVIISRNFVDILPLPTTA